MSSSRLRSRLAHGNFDAAQAAKVTENFVLIGTPLPSLDKHDPNEGKPVWEQEVRDEQGRRRFHGAFTGGWSAGYFNTVGSKEGWTPSTFVSSRSGRAGKASGSATVKQARPEDFMDDEDLAELEESRKLGHRDGYAAVDDPAKNRHQDEVLGDLLGLGGARRQIEDAAETRLVAPRSSLGHQILTRMGWRSGSGLGPRVTGKRRRLMEQLFSSSSGAPLKRWGEADSATVPPPDTPMPALAGGSAKRDTHGLGWQPGGESSTRDMPKGQMHQRGQGFDISVLEEADEDDVADIYAQSESIQATIERRRKAAQAGQLAQAPNRTSTTYLERDALGNEEATRWRDGKPVPPEFIIDAISIIDNRQEQQDWFPPPEVPPGWKPDPVRVWSRAKSAAPPPFFPSPPPSQRSQGRSGLQAADRARLLGEARMPGSPPSLSNYLPSAPQPPPKQPEPTSVVGPKLEVATAKAALQGFIPFGNDEGKQKRYIAYLESQADESRRGDQQPVPKGKTAEQVKSELEEFARSASIFKPLSSAMANRFASAITREGAGDAHAPAPGLYQPEAKSKEDREEEAKRKAEEEQARLKREREANMTDRQRAAQASMFGHLTREVKPWQPPRLLCKRFGVPEPHAGKAREEPSEEAMDGLRPPRDDGDPFYGTGREDGFQRSDARRELKRGEARWERSKRELLGLVGERKWEEQGGQPLPAGADGPASGAPAGDKARARADVPASLETVGLGEDENQLREIDAVPKPSRDVFKSVFASDEEDSEDEAEEVPSQVPAYGSQSAELHQSGAGADSSTNDKAARGLARPTFVPRKKRLDIDDPAESPSAPPASKPKKRKKEDKKKKASGALTFNFDEDEGGEGVTPRSKPPAKHASGAQHATDTQAKAGRDGPTADEQVSARESRATAGRRERTKAADLF